MADLSPAAQAVWDAAWNLSPVNCESHEDRRRQQIAAALRAAVDQVLPEQSLEDMPGRFINGCCHEQRQHSRIELLAIAAELEAACG